MTRNERITRRAEAAERIGLLYTAAYWNRAVAGKADKQDAELMQSERVAAHEDDWAAFVAADKLIDAEYQASKREAA